MNLPAEGALVMRRRSPWEAADSGILLWRDSFTYFIPFFALPIWTIAFALRMMPEFLRPWSYLILWWMKPLFDRLVLHIVSIRFFEPHSGISRLRRGLGALFFRGLPGDLLWRRFDPRRSARMPVRLLEKLRGQPLRQREKILERGGLDFCFLITLLGLALEAVLLLGEGSFILSTVKMFRPDLSFQYTEFFIGFEIFIFALYCFNFMLVESLYVCMGFGIYLNSRVEVEGWDIQLLFQHFAGQKALAAPYPREKPQPPRGGAGGNGAGLMFLCLIFLLAPLRGGAETAEEAGEEEAAAVKVLIPGSRRSVVSPVSPSPAAPLEDLDLILASEDFGGERETWGIRFKEPGEKKEPKLDFFFYQAPWMEKVRLAAAYILRLALAAAIAAGVVFSLYHFFKLRRASAPPGDPRRRNLVSPPPESSRTLLDRAGELHRQGRNREAWAACLAGTIAAYTEYRGLPLPRDATEYDCLALVRAGEAAASGGAAGFEELVRRWIRFAYGGREPGAEDFEQSLDFGRSLLRSPEKPLKPAGQEGIHG